MPPTFPTVSRTTSYLPTMKKVSRMAQSEGLLKAFMKSRNALANTFFMKSEGFGHLVNPTLCSTQAALTLTCPTFKFLSNIYDLK